MEAFHEAVNAQDAGRLAALASEDVEVGGPRGSGHGVALLREWVARAGVHLEPRRVFRRDQVVVVEQGAQWRAAETGEVTGRQAVASVFVVRAGRLTSVVRHPDLGSALRAAGLTESDEVPRPGS